MLDVYGLAGIIIFYTLVLAIGVWAGTKQKNNGEEEVMLAGRNVGLFVGVLTLTGKSTYLFIYSEWNSYGSECLSS